MEILQKLNNIIQQINQQNIINDKINVLLTNNNDQDICKLFKFIYNPFINFQINSNDLKTHSDESEICCYDLLQILEFLSTNKWSIKKRISVINGYIKQNQLYEELIYNIIDKDLNFDLTVDQINIGFNNIIPIFKVCRVKPYNKTKKYQLQKYNIQKKCNGLRMITIITHNNLTNENIITNYFKSGQVYNFENINQELLQFYKDSKYYGQDIVFDGECCYIDKKGKQDKKFLKKEIKQNNHNIQRIKYNIFDFLTLEEFLGLKDSKDYNWRRDKMLRLFFGFTGEQQFKYLNIIFSTNYTKDHFEKLMERFIATNKWQGLIFRKNEKYDLNDKTAIIKLQLQEQEQFIVTDIQKGTVPIIDIQNNKIAQEKECVVGLIVKDIKGNFYKVNNGIPDQQKINWLIDPMKIIGKTIIIKYMNKNKTALKYSYITKF